MWKIRWEMLLHVLFFVLSVWYMIKDPFELSPATKHDFRPIKTNISSYKKVMENWHGDNRSRLVNGKLEFVDQVFGPESLEFDSRGYGPYAGLADGRIVRWMGNETGWETFALVTQNWSQKLCSIGKNSTSSKQWQVESLCGRPLGLRFDKKSDNLYIADAYHGLLVVGPEGGIATSLATHAGGNPILFANDLDVHKNGSVFFTDTSKKYNRVNHLWILLEGEATGRLLKYDPPTGETHVILEGLAFPNGVQLSQDQSFLLFTETTNCRMMKLWLEGPKSGTVELVADLPGFPDNVRMNERGQFWVAIDCCRTRAEEILIHYPWLRSIYFRLPIPLWYSARLIGMKMYSVITLLNEKGGEIVDVLEDRHGEVVKLISEIREVKGKLWIGSVVHNHIATISYP